MSLTKDDIKNARKELELALLAVQKKTGISFNVGIIRFDATSMRCKIEGNVVAAGAATAVKVDPKLAELKKVAARILGKTVDLDKSYKSPSLGKVKIVGYNSRAIKYPFIVLTTAGKRYKLPTYTVQDMVIVGDIY